MIQNGTTIARRRTLRCFSIWKFLMILCLLARPVAAWADSPLPPPSAVTACSASGAFCAESDPAKNRTAFVEQASGKALWSIPGWHRWLFVADDGVSLVVGYGGMNLVPRDIGLDESVLFFYRRGMLVREVKLKEFYRSKSAMDRTVSHYAWVNTLGFDRDNRFVVTLVNGRKVMFDPATGLRLKRRTEP